MKNSASDEMKQAALRIARPLSIYKIIDDKQCYGLVSAGDFSEPVSRLFDNGEYTKALFLDAAADELLFQLDNELAAEIEKQLCANGLVAVRRESPGSQLPLTMQAEILRELGAFAHGISLTDEMMLFPLKTMTFVLRLESVDAGNPSATRHSCESCARFISCGFKAQTQHPPVQPHG